MERTSWKLPHGTYTMKDTWWKVHNRSYLMELTSWKLPHGTYTIEDT